jgi:hypothetical protein
MTTASGVYFLFKTDTYRSAMMGVYQESQLKKYTLSSNLSGSRHQFGDHNLGILEQSYLVSISFQH